LTITGPVNFVEFERIHYLQKGVDLNLCDPTTDFYTTADTPDLSKATASMKLTSTTKAADDLLMRLTVLDTGVVNIKWTYDVLQPDKKQPFEVPQDVIDVDRTASKDKKLSDYVTVLKDPATSAVTIKVLDANKAPAYTLNGFQLANHFNLIDSTVHTDKSNFKGVMGVFEQVATDLFLKSGIYSLWARDSPNDMQDGSLPGKNIYGTHPFFMAKTPDNGSGKKAWLGVFYNLANAQDWRVTNDAGSGDVKIRTTAAGGLGDLFFMSDASPNNVAKMYHTIVGKPVLVPQWSLGWHQCRWGYKDLAALTEVRNKFTELKLPLDTLWSDIDYLEDYKNFEVDPAHFKDLGKFVQDLHTNGWHYVPIIDAGIAAMKGYAAYEKGLKDDIFMKTDTGDVFKGRVWPGDAAFPDYMSPKARTWLSGQLDSFYAKVPFDGLWEDMNEASNFCDGACYLH